MFCKLVRPVGGAFFPEDLKIFLDHFILQPPQTHVPSFQLLKSHSVVNESIGHLIVCLEGHGQLWVTHGGQQMAERDIILRIVEQCTGFGLSCTGNDMLEGTAFSKNRPIGCDFHDSGGSHSGGRPRSQAIAELIEARQHRRIYRSCINEERTNRGLETSINNLGVGAQIGWIYHNI